MLNKQRWSTVYVLFDHRITSYIELTLVMEEIAEIYHSHGICMIEIEREHF